jgi:hypothetical protein
MQILGVFLSVLGIVVTYMTISSSSSDLTKNLLAMKLIGLSKNVCLRLIRPPGCSIPEYNPGPLDRSKRTRQD